MSDEDKRQRILEGMLTAVGELGYERASVRTVLDRSGVYRQAFYDNFSCKRECFLEACDLGVARVESAVRMAASHHSTWRAQLHAGLGALLDFLDAEPLTARALIVEVHPAGREAVARRTAALARTHPFLDRARGEPGADRAAPSIAAEAIASGIHAVIHSRLAAGESSGFRQLLPELMYVAMLPFFGDEAGRTAVAPAC
ncbi:MAG: TetR/AcrR family transcriptional regulator [Syntrophothermus sp.]